MNTKFLSIVLILWFQVANAQKNDFVWLAGDDNKSGITSHGGLTIDFNTTPRSVVYKYREANFFTCNTSICDDAGNLLFYTNGCSIWDKDDNIIPNGDVINDGEAHKLRCDSFNEGYAGGFPSAVILPRPDTKEEYYLFHLRTVYVSQPKEDAYNKHLLYSVVGLEGSGSDKKFVVKAKNVELMNDSLAYGEMCAVKHGNGRDWWLIQPRRNSNQFYVFLFTKNGITDTLLQTIGDKAPKKEEGSGQTTFSHDGTRMVRYFPEVPVMLYDFDRLSGRFSNYRRFSIDYGNDYIQEGGAAFSPSGRFLYITELLQVYQFDLWAPDISASQIKVGIWDGFKDPIAVGFSVCQLGPDCKIYSKTGDMRYYHIIHNPDAQGLACQFEQRGLKLPTPSGPSIPYFPNYRLGPVDNPGKPCSPVVQVSEAGEDEVGVRVWPNPAQDQINVDYFLPQDRAAKLLIYNTSGQIVSESSLSSGRNNTQISITQLPEGIYWYALPGTNLLPSKFVINR